MLGRQEELKADVHYSVGVFQKSPYDQNSLPPSSVILADFKSLGVDGYLHPAIKATHYYLFLVEPETDVTAGQLYDVGLRRGVIMGVWHWTNVPEWFLDSYEVMVGVQEMVAFVSRYWIAIGALLMVALGVFVYLVLRKR